MSGKCVHCSKTVHQGYNGRWYCNKHHPQRICKCGRNAGRYLHEGDVCDDCRRHQQPVDNA